MNKKILLLAIVLTVGFAVLWGHAQYNGFDLERNKPPTLFPTAGPGSTAILNELRETNRLLQEQNQLLQEQTRLLRANLAAPKK